MEHFVNQTPPVRLAIVVTGLIAVILAMRSASEVLAPFFLALLFAVLFWMPLDWLRRRGAPTWVSLLTVGLIIVLLGAGFSMLVSATLNAVGADLPAYEQKLASQATVVETMLAQYGIDLKGITSTIQSNEVSPINALRDVLGGLGSLLSNTFLIAFYVIFMLVEVGAMRNKIAAAFGGNPAAFEYFSEVSASLRTYVVVETAVSALVGTAIGLSLWLIGVDFAATWGVLAFLLNFVPNFGPILAAIPAVTIAFIEFGPSIQVLLVIGAYAIITVVIGSIIFPRIMGQGVGLSTLVVLVSLIFWGWVLGPVGLILSVPLTATVKIFLQEYEGTRWLAIFLGSDPGDTQSP